MLALAETAMPFAHSAEDEAERWVRVMRMHGQVGVALQALGVGEAPLMTAAEPAIPSATARPPLGPDVLETVTDRARGVRHGARGGATSSPRTCCSR